MCLLLYGQLLSQVSESSFHPNVDLSRECYVHIFMYGEVWHESGCHALHIV